MKYEITNKIPATVRKQLDFLAQTLGSNSFFIQDTETTGTGELDQIHDFAGMYYENGRVYQVQYYVVQPNDKDENGLIHVDFNALRELYKNSPAFKYMMGTDKDSNEAYRKMREAMDKKTWDEKDPMITRENLGRLLKDRYGKVPNFAYNARFDISMEQKLNSAIKSNIKFNEVYDVLTMAVDLMPEILPADMGKNLGKIKLEKVYKYIDSHYKDEFSKFKTTVKGGKQTHTAWDDAFRYTVPVLNFLVERLSKQGYNIKSYKNIQSAWRKAGVEGKQQLKEAGFIIGPDIDDYFKRKGRDPKWVAGTIGSKNVNALREISMINQLTLTTNESVKAVARMQKQTTQSEQRLVKDELAVQKRYLSKLRAQRAEASEVVKARNNINELGKIEKRLNSRVAQLDSVVREIDSNASKMEANTRSIIQNIINIRNSGDFKRSQERVEKYIKQILKSNSGSKSFKYDEKENLIHLYGRETIQAPTGGKKVVTPYIDSVSVPDWWGKDWSNLRALKELRAKLKNFSALTPSELSRITKQLERVSTRRKSLASKLETQNKNLSLQAEGIMSQIRQIEAHHKEGTAWPKQYFNLTKKLGTIREKQKVINGSTSISLIDDRISETEKRIKELTTNIKTFTLASGKKVGVPEGSTVAYYLDGQGRLTNNKVSPNLWDRINGTPLGMEAPIEKRERTRFGRITPQQLKMHPELRKDMTIIPLKATLDTSISVVVDSTGHQMVVRAHKTSLNNTKENEAFQGDKIYSVTELTSVLSEFFGRESGENWHSDYGTAEHRIIEDIFNPSKRLKKNSMGLITKSDLMSYVRTLWHAGSSEDKYDMRALFTKDGRLNTPTLDLLFKGVNEYLKSAKKAGVPDSAHMEHTLGMVMRTHGKDVTIVGTLDQFYKSGLKTILTDIKTSKAVREEYVPQLSIYAVLLRAAGLDAEKVFKIWLTPADMERVGGIVNVKAMSDKDVADFVFEASEVLEERNKTLQKQKQQKLVDKWAGKLGEHIENIVTHNTVKNIYGVEETRHFINGQTISEFGKTLARRYKATDFEIRYEKLYKNYRSKNPNSTVSFEEFLKSEITPNDYSKHLDFVNKRAKVVEDALNNIKDPRERSRIRNLLLSRGDNGEPFYDGFIYDAYRFKNDKTYAMLSRRGKDVSLNEIWLKGAKESGISDGRLGGLTARQWINLIKSVNLDEFYRGSKVNKGQLTNKQQIKKVLAENIAKKYDEALNILADAVLYGYRAGVTGLVNTPIGRDDPNSLSIAEDFQGLQKFVKALTERDNSIQLPKKFMSDLYKKYDGYCATHARRIDFVDFVKKHTDTQTVRFFNVYQERRAVERLLSYTGIGKLSKVVFEQEEEHSNDSIRFALEYQQTQRELFDNYRKNDEDFDVDTAKYGPEDESYRHNYDKYTPSKEREIRGQLPQRVARMLTRGALGDQVYGAMYKDFLKRSAKNSSVTFEQFLKILTPEQKREYDAAKHFRKMFDQAIKSNKGASFLVDLSKELSIGADEESRNLLSLIKSIAVEKPEILVDPSIIGEIGYQVKGQKMRHYANFDAKLLAEMGYPLTLVGKTINEKNFKSPAGTFANNFGSLVNEYNKKFDKETEGLLSSNSSKSLVGKIKAFLRKPLDSVTQEDFNKLSTDTLQRIDILSKSFNSRSSDGETDFSLQELLSKLSSTAREYYSAVREFQMSQGTEFAQEDKTEALSKQKAVLLAITDIDKVYNLLRYRAAAWAQPGLAYNVMIDGDIIGNKLLGREAGIYKLNEAVQKYGDDFSSSNEEATRQEHLKLLQEDAAMAKGSLDIRIDKLISSMERLAQAQENAARGYINGTAGGVAAPVNYNSMFEEEAINAQKPLIAKMWASEINLRKGKLNKQPKSQLKALEKIAEDAVKEYYSERNKASESMNEGAHRDNYNSLIMKAEDEEFQKQYKAYYEELLSRQANLRKGISGLNVKLKGVDPASAMYKLLSGQKKDLQKEWGMGRKELDDVYSILSGNNEQLLSPQEALKKVNKEAKLLENQAKQEKALEEYNAALKEQVELETKILELEEKIQAARRKGDQETVKLLAGQKDKLSGGSGAANEKVQNALKVLEDAYGHKLPENLKTLEGEMGERRALHEIRMSESDYADYRQFVGQYEGLKKQEASLIGQLYRNDLKYKTTYNAKERSALDLQGSLLGADLDSVQEQLAEIERQASGIKAFAFKKAELDKTFSDIQAKNIANANVAFKGENTLFGKLTTSFKGMLYHFTQFGAAYKILGAVKQGISNVVTSAKNLDKALTDLRIVTGQSGSEAKNTMQRFAELGSQLGVTTNEVAKSATAWLRQGYDMAQVTDLVTSSMYLSKLGMISVDEATQGLTSTLKGFKLEAREAMDVVDKFTALDVKAATTAGEIATGLAQFANLASMSGVSVDQASAMVATIADVSQVSGAQAGNSLKMMLSRYGTVKSGKFSSMEGEGDTEALNDVEKVLTKIGISMRDTNGQFKEFDQVLDEIAEKWDNLDNISQAAIATAVAGTRQREAFLVLMQNMDKYRNFTEISEGSKGTAEKKYQSYQEQLQAAQNRLAAAWEKIAQDADIASFITHFVNFSTFMVKHMPTLLKTVTRLIAIWQGYKIPTLMQQGMQFTGLTPLFGAVGGLFKKGGVRGAIASGNENIRKFVTGESNRFGGGATDKWLETISKQIEAIIGKQQAREGTADEIEEASQEMAINAEKAAQSSAQGAANEDHKTAEGVKKVNLERQETQAAGGGRASVYTGKGGKGMVAASIASGAAGIISGVMTTGGSHYSVNGGTTESSSEASGAMKGISAGVNAVGMIGYIWGPIGGMISQTIASLADQFLTPLIGMWIDADRDARNARVEEAQKQLSSLEAIQSAVSNIESTVSVSAVSYEDNQALIKQMRELKNSLLENIDALKRASDIMKMSAQDIFDKLNNWANLSQEQRQEFLYKLEAAISSSIGNTTIAAAENDFYSASKSANDLRTFYDSHHNDKGIYGKDKYNLDHSKQDAFKDEFLNWASATGVDVDYQKDKWVGGYTYKGEPVMYYDYYAAFKSTGQQLIDEYKSFIDWLTKADASKYANTIKEYQKIIRDYETQLAKINEVYREANENLTAAAIVSASIATSSGSVNLLSANTDQLKRAGREGIYNAVVGQLIANGGFRGYAVDSKEGKSIIEEAIKSNERLYAVWTGQIYTLNEALSAQNTEVLRSFATALGVSVDELSNLKDELGDLKLADILESPSATRSKISEITSLFTSMATSSGLTAENMEAIINKFPELIHNLKDGVALGADLLKMLGQYNALYSRQLLGDLLGNEDYFTEFKDRLKEISEEAYNDLIDNSKYGGATNAQGILGLLAGSFEDSGLQSRESYDLLKSLYSEYFDFTTKSSLGTEVFETYVSYWNKVWDKQISNLEQQKTALQEINKQREYENKLVEARLRLENASKEKKRIYREGVGWVYEADQNAIKEAQENLEQVQHEQTISELDRQIEEISYIKETLNKIAENNELENLESSWESFIGDAKLSDYASVTKLAEQFEALTTVVVNGFDAVVNYNQAKESMFNTTYGQENSSWSNLQNAQRDLDNAAKTYGKNSSQYYEAQTAYNNALDAFQADSSAYENRYGGEPGWDDNITAEQKGYLNSGHIEDSRGTLTIKSGNTSKTYTTGEKIVSGSQLYDDIEGSAKTKKGQHLQSWIYDPKKGSLDLSQGATSTYSDEFVKKYNGDLGNWAAAMLQENPDKGVVFARSEDHKHLGIVLPQGVLNAPSSGLYALDAARRGSLGVRGGPTLINEEGPEAIITPGGTLTSLPSKTGVVPADITRSVWQLGELAPSILRVLGYNGGNQFASGSGIVNNSDSVNIGSVIMQVSADAGFDPERFVEELKTQAALSKNNRR